MYCMMYDLCTYFVNLYNFGKHSYISSLYLKLLHHNYFQ